MANVGRPDKKDLSPEHSLGQKKIRYSAPNIDGYLRLKWGLALLGEEQAKEYLAWLVDTTRQDTDKEKQVR
jgi:hypothetical protein